MRQRQSNPWKGFLLGAVGGIAGVLAMRYYWKTVTAALGHDPREQKQGTPETDVLDSVSLIGRRHRPGESSTAALGRILYTWVTGKEPQSQETATTLSYGIHWIFSMGVSGFYGALQQRAEFPDVDGGLVLGTSLWLLGDELAMPMLGLADGPTAYPPELHVHSFGAHMAYGVACSAATQFLYRLF